MVGVPHDQKIRHARTFGFLHESLEYIQDLIRSVVADPTRFIHEGETIFV